MRVIIAGGSGFLGRALTEQLRARGDVVKVLTRRARPERADEVTWTPDGTAGDWGAVVDGADAVINLAGEGIADKRWTEARKRALRESRLLSTQSLVAAINAAVTPPRLMISASGVGYYGFRGNEVVDEQAAPGTDFLATLCVDWERAAQAASSRCRVVITRNGVVLGSSGGALPRMALPFKFGVGGPLGSGQQYLPWIHLDDWIALVEWLLDGGGEPGAFNATAPEPVTNRAFSHALGRALRRPSIVPVPAFALRLAVGELADSLLTGQRVIPANAQRLGFRFQFPTIDGALSNVFSR